MCHIINYTHPIVKYLTLFSDSAHVLNRCIMLYTRDSKIYFMWKVMLQYMFGMYTIKNFGITFWELMYS